MFFRLALLSAMLLTNCMGFPQVEALQETPVADSREPAAPTASTKELRRYLKLLPIDAILAPL